MSEKDPNDMGGLWEKTSAKGIWMSGTINGQAVVVFRNDRKVAGSNQPDWRVLRARRLWASVSQTGGNAEAQFAPGPVTDEEMEPF